MHRAFVRWCIYFLNKGQKKIIFSFCVCLIFFFSFSCESIPYVFFFFYRLAYQKFFKINNSVNFSLFFSLVLLLDLLLLQQKF